MKKSQTRMWKTLQGEPQFIISVAETQNVLEGLEHSSQSDQCGRKWYQ
jgi:hypothetical protein